MLNRHTIRRTGAVLSLLVCATLLLSGCSGFMDDSRAEAHEDWDRVRAEAICQQAEEHLRLGQLARSAQLARDAITLSPDYADARIVLARALIERGQYTMACDELRQVMRGTPDSVEALYLLGVAYEKDGRLEDALRCYRDAYELDRDHYDSVLGATEVLVQMGELSEARRYLARHRNQADGNAAAFELAGRLARMDEDYADAAVAYQQALEMDALNISYLEELAVAQVLSGQLASAVESLELRTRRVDVPAPRWVWTILGDCYLNDDRFEESITAFIQARELAPEEAGSWVDLAKAYAKAGQYAEAASCATRALGIEPGHLDASLLAGYTLLQLDRLDDAARILNQAVTRHPENCLLLCLMGHLQQADGNTAEARYWFQRAAEIDPDHPLVWALREGTIVHTASVMR
jgi:tetratricopeptide (TPR) repeat protein